MTITWNPLGEYEIHQKLIAAPWILVLETFGGSTLLQIKADGSWMPAGVLLPEFSADGLLDAAAQTERLIVPNCAVGALIGKFGGSSASLSPAPQPNAATTGGENSAFAVGSHCIVSVPDKCIGPLYVSFNGLIRPVAVKDLKIMVFGATPTT